MALNLTRVTFLNTIEAGIMPKTIASWQGFKLAKLGI